MLRLMQEKRKKEKKKKKIFVKPEHRCLRAPKRITGVNSQVVHVLTYLLGGS